VLVDGVGNGLVQGVQEVVEAGVEAGLGVDPAVVLHTDVDVGEMDELDHREAPPPTPPHCGGEGSMLRAFPLSIGMGRG
jgi:hypothetical protein